MTIFNTTVRFLLVVFPVTLSRSRNSSFLYSCFCIFDIPTMRIVSVLGGNPLKNAKVNVSWSMHLWAWFKKHRSHFLSTYLATSTLSLRRRKGVKILWSCEIMFFLASSSSISKLNQSSNCSALEKISIEINVDTKRQTREWVKNLYLRKGELQTTASCVTHQEVESWGGLQTMHNKKTRASEYTEIQHFQSKLTEPAFLTPEFV
jgi:hypothetical protein